MSKKLVALASTMNACYESRQQFINEYCYQHGHTGRDTVFTDGNHYFAIGKRKPAHECGLTWEPHPDQFWAAKLGLTVWFSRGFK